MSAKLINKKDIVRTEIHRDTLNKECLLSLRQHEASCHVQSNSFLLDIVRAISKYLDKAIYKTWFQQGSIRLPNNRRLHKFRVHHNSVVQKIQIRILFANIFRTNTTNMHKKY
jgi:hypothetical protein